MLRSSRSSTPRAIGIPVAALLVLAATFSAAPSVSAQVGGATVVPIQETGPASARFNMVVMGDGYTEAEMPLFRAQVDQHLNVMWSIEPFRSYRNYINVYAIEIVSGESGVSCDPHLTSPRRTTPLSMAFWGGCNASSVQRLLTVNSTAANQYANMVTGTSSSNRQILAIANSRTYGGAGGTYATASGGNALSALISPHELGHSLGGLQDEYTYFQRGVPGGAYTGGEPSSIHHSLLTVQQMLDQQRKWWRWLGEQSESGGVIARYEGGMTQSSGVWRPSEHSMMKSLGYYFDQVSRERMTQRISSRLGLIQASTPTADPVPASDVLWVETVHPVYHELDVTWRVNGQVVEGTGNSRNLELARLDVRSGDAVTVTVVDPTDFVRDPAIRGSASMTATRSWTIGTPPVTATAVGALTQGSTPVAFTAWTQTERAVGRDDVVYVETTHPTDRVLDVTWRLNGHVVPNPANRRNLDLGDHDLAPGTNALSATVTDPADPGGASQTLTWSVDNQDATVRHDVTPPRATLRSAGVPHYLFFEQFGMTLDPTDDRPGYLVAEFRLNGDGWHHYYGWPTDADAPFLFTPRGTNVDDLIYGNLGSGGLSMAPFEPRTAGYGTHTIEYRGIDAAGNIGPAGAFRATVLPGGSPACTTTISGIHPGSLVVSEGVTCLDRASVGAVTVSPGASLVASDSSINGRLSTKGAETVHLFGTSVNAVNGGARISGTTRDVTIAGTTFNGTVSLADNAGGSEGIVLAGNTVNGPLGCTGNTPAVTDLGAANTVHGPTTGQCAAL